MRPLTQVRIGVTVLIVSAFSTGCDDDPTWLADVDTGAPIDVAILTIQPDSIRLAVGDVIRFQISAWDAEGNWLGNAVSAQMLSSDPGVLHIGGDGRASAVKPGRAVVTAYKFSHQTQARVWVECKPH